MDAYLGSVGPLGVQTGKNDLPRREGHCIDQRINVKKPLRTLRPVAFFGSRRSLTARPPATREPNWVREQARPVIVPLVSSPAETNGC